MKKAMAIILSAVLILGLAACGGDSPPSDSGAPIDSPNITANDPHVESIRNGVLEFYPSKKLGQALSGFLTNIKWESETADDGFTYVNVSGGCLYHDKPATVLVRYRLYDDDTFEFYAIEIDGEAHGFELYFELIVLSFENEILSIIKEGALYDYPNQPMGRAFNAFFEDIKWEVVAADDLEVYVNVGGTLLYGDEEAYAALQYRIDTMELTFEYNAFELDGVPQPDYMYIELITLIFE